MGQESRPSDRDGGISPSLCEEKAQKCSGDGGGNEWSDNRGEIKTDSDVYGRVRKYPSGGGGDFTRLQHERRLWRDEKGSTRSRFLRHAPPSLGGSRRDGVQKGRGGSAEAATPRLEQRCVLQLRGEDIGITSGTQRG